jgi:hypothetical protein
MCTDRPSTVEDTTCSADDISACSAKFALVLHGVEVACTDIAVVLRPYISGESVAVMIMPYGRQFSKFDYVVVAVHRTCYANLQNSITNWYICN